MEREGATVTALRTATKIDELELLEVSRDFELEADQLGVQYAWNAGYDPSGFIRFFDKVATRKGYVNGANWFRPSRFLSKDVDTKRGDHVSAG